MNRFSHFFNDKNKKAFIPFFTIGDPNLEDSYKIVSASIKAGADAVELGFPFSDPIADGPTNQRSMERALKAGATFEKCNQFLKKLRSEFPDIPIGLLLYYNLLFQQGDAGYHQLSKGGVDCIVSADLPIEEADQNIKSLDEYNIGSVQMIAPNTPDKRALELFAKSNSYTYVLSGFGVTGAKSEVAQATIERVEHIKSLSDKPIVVGFGISKPEHARVIWDAGANGVIVGSYFTSIIEENIDSIQTAINYICDFINQVNLLKR
ncbi:MAG: tryptophan synthase alpha chain [Francisellaceae bacterium]|jgi:tryptophan synthase alpha chain